MLAVVEVMLIAGQLRRACREEISHNRQGRSWLPRTSPMPPPGMLAVNTDLSGAELCAILEESSDLNATGILLLNTSRAVATVRSLRSERTGCRKRKCSS